MAFKVLIVAGLLQMEVSILFPFRFPLCIKLHENYEVCKWCFALEFPSYFWCLGVVLIFCVGKALNARPGNCVCFVTREQGSRTEEDVSIVLWWCFFFFFPARGTLCCAARKTITSVVGRVVCFWLLQHF